MTIEYKPKGVCARAMSIEVEDGVVRELAVAGGCSGNLRGISALVKGQPVDEIIARLDGICCGPKATSCPDQLARALKEARAAGRI